MTTMSLDHIHLRGHDPEAAAEFLHRNFDVEIVERLQVRGLPGMVLRLGAVTLFVEGATEAMPCAPAMPFRGIEHVCVRVSDIEAHVARLARNGVDLHTVIQDVRPGVRIAYVEAPGGIIIEMVERSSAGLPA